MRAPGGEVLALVQHTRGDLAQLTAGGDHEHHAMPLGRGPGHRAAGGDRLVVGVRVEDDQGAGHGSMSSPSAPRDLWSLPATAEGQKGDMIWVPGG